MKGVIMGFLDMFDKLDDIVYEPIKMICNWAQEPIRRFQTKRDAEAAQQAADIEAAKRSQEVELEVAKQERLARLQADQRRWNSEVDHLIAEQEIERNTRIFDTMTEYRRLMMSDIKDIAYAISLMEIDLVKQVYDLIEVKMANLEKMRAAAVENRKKELLEIKDLFDQGVIDEETKKDMTKDSITFTLDFSKECTAFIHQLKTDTERIAIANSERTKRADQTIEQIFRDWGKTIGMSTDTVIPSFSEGDSTIPKLVDNS